MSLRSNLIMIFLLVPMISWGQYGTIYGTGEAPEVEKAIDLATLDLARKIETKVYSRVQTKNTNGKQSLVSNITSVTSVNIEGTEREITKTKDGYLVYCTLNVDEYIKKHIELYNEYYSHIYQKRSNWSDRAGYAYMAFTAIDNPIMDYYVKGNEDAKKELRSIVDRVRIERKGNFAFSIWDEYNRIVLLDPPIEWRTGEWDKAKKTDKMEVVRFAFR